MIVPLLDFLVSILNRYHYQFLLYLILIFLNSLLLPQLFIQQFIDQLVFIMLFIPLFLINPYHIVMVLMLVSIISIYYVIDYLYQLLILDDQIVILLGLASKIHAIGLKMIIDLICPSILPPFCYQGSVLVQHDSQHSCDDMCLPGAEEECLGV